MKITRPLAGIIAAAFLNSCVHSSASVRTDLVAADAKCNATQLDSATAKVNCFTELEGRIIHRDLPFAWDAYQLFAARRLGAAKAFDRETALGEVAWNRFVNGTRQATAVLIAHDPRFNDTNTKLQKDINAVNIVGICSQIRLTERVTCFDEIMRPIWIRDAANTLSYYDEFRSKQMQLARDFDATFIQIDAPAAIGRYRAQIRQAVAEFRTNAMRAQQAAEQEAADRRAEARAKAAEAGKQLANFIGTLAVTALAAVAVIGGARIAATPAFTQVQSPQYVPMPNLSGALERAQGNILNAGRAGGITCRPLPGGGVDCTPN